MTSWDKNGRNGSEVVSRKFFVTVCRVNTISGEGLKVVLFPAANGVAGRGEESLVRREDGEERELEGRGGRFSEDSWEGIAATGSDLEGFRKKGFAGLIKLALWSGFPGLSVGVGGR